MDIRRWQVQTGVTTWIMQTKKTFGQAKHLLVNESISTKVRMRVLRCYIWPVVMYECEAWTINKEIENRLIVADI